MSYQFKVGDTVKFVKTGNVSVIESVHTTKNGLHYVQCEGVVGWTEDDLTLICPAGYRPVREDEMDQCPVPGDIWMTPDGGTHPVMHHFITTFREMIARDLGAFYRPIPTTAAPETEEQWVDFVPVVGERYPEKYRLGNHTHPHHWGEGVADLVSLPNNHRYRYQKLVKTMPQPQETEMTTARWNAMTTPERCAYNLPAFMAMGEGRTVEWFTILGWREVDSLSLSLPHRVKPATPPKPIECWITTFPDGTMDNSYEKESAARAAACNGGRVVRMVEASGDTK